MKQLQFKHFDAVYNETTRQVQLFGLTEGGAIYRQRDNPADGFECVQQHRWEPPAQEKPASKSMQKDKDDDE